jgi:O-antigen ligase
VLGLFLFYLSRRRNAGFRIAHSGSASPDLKLRPSHLRVASRLSALLTAHALAPLALLAGALLFFYADPANLSQRLASIFGVAPGNYQTFTDRQQPALDSLHMLRDYPATGVGLGAWETAYTRYRSFPSGLRWDYAHNDYAQALAETGILGGLLILSAIVLFFRSSARNSTLDAGPVNLDRPRTLDLGSWTLDPLRVAAALAVTGLLAHSVVDFNLHIPANAAWFAFCAGFAVVAPQTPAPETRL